MGKETNIQNEILLKLGGRTDCRVFRNTVGVVECAKSGRYITYGLCPGSGDIIGWKTVTVTPEMVGKKVAVFTSVEVKQPKKELAKHQENWRKTVADAGGFALKATSPMFSEVELIILESELTKAEK